MHGNRKRTVAYHNPINWHDKRLRCAYKYSRDEAFAFEQHGPGWHRGPVPI